MHTNDAQLLLHGAAEVNEPKRSLLQSHTGGSPALPSAHSRTPLASVHGCSMVNEHYCPDVGLLDQFLGTTKAKKEDTAIKKMDPCFLSLEWDWSVVCLKQFPEVPYETKSP